MHWSCDLSLRRFEANEHLRMCLLQTTLQLAQNFVLEETQSKFLNAAPAALGIRTAASAELMQGCLSSTP